MTSASVPQQSLTGLRTSGGPLLSESRCFSSGSSFTIGLLPVAIKFSAFVLQQRTFSLLPSLFFHTSSRLGPDVHCSLFSEGYWSVASLFEKTRHIKQFLMSTGSKVRQN